MMIRPSDDLSEVRRLIGAGPRVLIVSHRLPLTVVRRDGALIVTSSKGGLASALGRVHDRTRGLWIGSPGETDSPGPLPRSIDDCLREHGAVGVRLSAAEVEGFYRRYSNGALWPMLHGLPYRWAPDRESWAHYRAVNERFADAVADRYQPGDTVWVHDYHLMLVPALVRRRVPSARIGFFLHTPLPAPATLEAFAHWDELRDGLLGADVIGFHTCGYANNFLAAAQLAECDDRVRTIVLDDHRRARIVANPISVDAAWWAARSRDPDVLDTAAAFRGPCAGPLFVGVDRLDYTKGIPERLLAFERLLGFEPGLRGRARFVQVAVPSREDVTGYADLRREVDALVTRINRDHGDASWTPIEYIYGNLDQNSLVALYRAADVMVVTPHRDGMNLVAKEFVASRTDGGGALVLSRFAGAADELRAAILVDPSDPSAVMDGYRRALSMTVAERRSRMRRLRAIVAGHDVYSWADRFLDQIREASPLVGTDRAWTSPRVVRSSA